LPSVPNVPAKRKGVPTVEHTNIHTIVCKSPDLMMEMCLGQSSPTNLDQITSSTCKMSTSSCAARTQIFLIMDTGSIPRGQIYRKKMVNEQTHLRKNLPSHAKTFQGPASAQEYRTQECRIIQHFKKVFFTVEMYDWNLREHLIVGFSV